MRKILVVSFLTVINFSFAAGATKSEPTPLLDALYEAARQENEKEAMRLLEKAQDLLARGADVKAVGNQGRTALHWVVIGAMYAKNERRLQTSMDLVDQLISRGADLNAEDEFGNTPLDYQENSPRTELLPLLLEHGARNGIGQDESERLRKLLDGLSSASRAGDPVQIRAALTFDLPSGAELLVRLTTEVSSDKSRSGDLVEAVVIAPVMVDGRLALAAGTRVQGTVMLAQKAGSDYQRAQLILNFANLIHPDGSKTQIVARLVDVDNAKESVQAGRILGLAHPNNSKLTWGFRLLNVTDPIFVVRAAIGRLRSDIRTAMFGWPRRRTISASLFTRKVESGRIESILKSTANAPKSRTICNSRGRSKAVCLWIVPTPRVKEKTPPATNC
jgi:hypothetical protein